MGWALHFPFRSPGLTLGAQSMHCSGRNQACPIHHEHHLGSRTPPQVHKGQQISFHWNSITAYLNQTLTQRNQANSWKDSPWHGRSTLCGLHIIKKILDWPYSKMNTTKTLFFFFIAELKALAWRLKIFSIYSLNHPILSITPVPHRKEPVGIPSWLLQKHTQEWQFQLCWLPVVLYPEICKHSQVARK